MTKKGNLCRDKRGLYVRNLAWKLLPSGGVPQRLFRCHVRWRSDHGFVSGKTPLQEPARL